MKSIGKFAYAYKTECLSTLVLCITISSPINVQAQWGDLHQSTAAFERTTTKINSVVKPIQSGRIVGGAPVQAQIPYMVSLSLRLENGFRHACGGTIISEHKVLTAAHCFDGVSADTDWRIYHNSNALDQAQRYTVSEIYIQPGYVPGTFVNDVAVVQTNQSFNVEPLKLATPMTEPTFDGQTEGDVFGWGVTSELGSETENTLNGVTVPIQTQNTCRSTYPNNEAVAQDLAFCAG
jgi:secreted trypsin-like serine protease